jgi:hypothetical protein
MKLLRELPPFCGLCFEARSPGRRWCASHWEAWRKTRNYVRHLAGEDGQEEAWIEEERAKRAPPPSAR